MEAVEEFRAHALNPEHPEPCAAATRMATSSSSIVRPATQYYNALPAVVEKYMGKVNEKLGTNYQLLQLLRRSRR